VFEIGRVFLRDAKVKDTLQTVAGIDQPMHVAGLSFGPVSPLGWNASRDSSDFFDLKADICALFAGQVLTFVAAEHPALHPGRCARIDSDGQAIGWMGELHPKWRQQWDFNHAPLLFELKLDAVLSHPIPQAKSISRLQAVERDLAVVVSESTSHQALMDCIWETSLDGLLQDAVLFDVYRPQKAGGAVSLGEKSLAVRLVLQSTDDTTLTEAQIDHAVQAALHQLSVKLNAKLRK
jgi:phenylalanyl-tRNA synthetase beta chain